MRFRFSENARYCENLSNFRFLAVSVDVRIRNVQVKLESNKNAFLNDLCS